MSPAHELLTGNASEVAAIIAPLGRLEIASIGAILSASPREHDAGYVMLFHETKTGKQANVEQINTRLRLTRSAPVESGGLAEPVLRLQTLALQKANTTAMLQAMRMVEELLVARYRAAVEQLKGFERQAMTTVRDRAVKHWMILIAHVAQRKDADSDHASLLPLPLSSYFASEKIKVCMRCLLDRPGAHNALEKERPYTYVCSACHDEVAAAFPADLQQGLNRAPAALRHDRIIEKALSRPLKLRAQKEAHSILAGLPPELPVPAAEKGGPVGKVRHATAAQPASDISMSRVGATDEELAYTDLLFDFMTVRRSW